MNGSVLKVLFFIQITIANPLPGQSPFPDIPRPITSTNYNNKANSFILSNSTQTRSRAPITTPFTTYPLNFTGDILATNPWNRCSYYHMKPRAGLKFRLEFSDLLFCCARLCQNKVRGEYGTHPLPESTIATTDQLQDYHTWLWTEVFNVKSLITVITKYAETTMTNRNTRIIASTTMVGSTFDAFTNELAADNYAPGPTRIINKLNGTALTSIGLYIMRLAVPSPPLSSHISSW